ncbi:MAG: flagellar hook-associated protein FlgL [Polaromonas sp.]|nr:flagellar hook-associated protein FlgL [Polaromonas sp.]
MRISTQSFYEQSRATMGSLQSNLLRVQQQMGANSKLLAPSDDPLGTTRAMALAQSIAINSQYSASRTQATQTLTQEESVLQSTTSVLQNVKVLLVQAGGTLNDSDRANIATSLQSNLDQLQGLANTDDGNGQFLFAGFKSGSAPFVRQADGAITYAGDQGQRLAQVDASRQMAGADDGRSIFLTVQGGAGYVSEAATKNTGSGVLGSASVLDAGNPNYGLDFQISFGVDGTYQIDTVPTSIAPADPAPDFTPGQLITFGGLQISISGAPVKDDIFKVSTAKNAGTDVFGAIHDAIKALKTPVDNGGPAAQAKLLNALGTANRKVTSAHDNVLTVRASVGSRLQELDALGATGDSRALNDKSSLSDLQDLDYASAISEFYQRQTALQASQQTFVKVQQISLFNYLK